MDRRIACSIGLLFGIRIGRIKSEKNFTFHHIIELEGILSLKEITNSFIESYRVCIRLICIDFTVGSLQ
jgi:hypothetical protein